ncbi:MAG: MbnP family protein [Ferruginibacter sp.]
MIKSILLLLLLGNNCIAQKNVTILFKNIANKNKIELDNTVYKNIFDENYTISKLKYYVSNIELVTLKKRNTKKSVYLINEKYYYNQKAIWKNNWHSIFDRSR